MGNLQKLRSVRDRATKYNMMDSLKIPVMIDSLTTKPVDCWGDETTKRDILNHWSQVDVADIIAFQQDTNIYASDADMTSSDWLKDFLMNSSEPELLKMVIETFEKLDSLAQGGITYLKYMLDEMFCMTNDVVTELQTFIKTFAEEGVSQTLGENVSEVSAQLRAVSERLSEVKQLPLKVPTYILQGLTKCLVAEITAPFELMLNTKRVDQMGTPLSMDNTSDVTLKQVLHILEMANNSFHSLNVSNSWNVTKGHHAARGGFTPTCFNCGDPHYLYECKNPRDEDKIARNKQSHEDNNKEGNGGGQGGHGGRKKWSKDSGG